MATRLVQISMNARDNSALGRFWAEALGWKVASDAPGKTNVEPDGFPYPDPSAVCIDVLPVPEPKTVKNRVHIDLATTSPAHQAALVTRLPISALSPPTWARATSHGPSWPTRKATSSASSPRSEACAGEALQSMGPR